MAARQFGFVVARGLAVYAWVNCIAQLAAAWSAGIMGANYPNERPLYGPNLLTGILLFLVGAFLWVTAKEFSGPAAEEAAKVQSGEWIVRLAFHVIGIFFVVNAIVNLTAGGLSMAFASNRFRWPEEGPYLAGDAIRFLIGLGLILTNRFTRPTFQSQPPQD